MKKLIILLALAMVVAGGVFAQEKAEAEAAEPAAPKIRKNAVTLDTIPLFKGFIASDFSKGKDMEWFVCFALAYERLIAPHFTIGGDMDFYNGKLGYTFLYFRLAAAGRYYPMSEYMEKFFVGARLGLSTQSLGNSYVASEGDFSGLQIGLSAGYKLLLGKMLSVEPSMSYTYEKTSSELFGVAPQNLGWQGGLRVGLSF